MERKPSEDRAVHEGDNPLFWSHIVQFHTNIPFNNRIGHIFLNPFYLHNCWRTSLFHNTPWPQEYNEELILILAISETNKTIFVCVFISPSKKRGILLFTITYWLVNDHTTSTQDQENISLDCKDIYFIIIIMLVVISTEGPQLFVQGWIYTGYKNKSYLLLIDAL
jgi:hypothetical protein